MSERTGAGVYYHANGDKYVEALKIIASQDGRGTFTWAKRCCVYEGDGKIINVKVRVLINAKLTDVYEGDWKIALGGQEL